MPPLASNRRRARIVGLRRIGKTVSVPKAFVLLDNDVALRLAQVLGGLGFASVFAVALLGDGRFLRFCFCASDSMVESGLQTRPLQVI